MKIPTVEQLKKIPNDLQVKTSKRYQVYLNQDIKTSRKYLAKAIKRAVREGKTYFNWCGKNSCKNFQIMETMIYMEQELKTAGYSIDDWKAAIVQNEYVPVMRISWND